MRILYIGLDFFTYMDEIADALRRQGHCVDVRPIEPRSFLAKTLKRYLPGRYARWLAAYHERIIAESAATRYDAVLFIQVHHFAVDALARLRNAQPNAKFVLYNWDSLRVHDYRPWAHLFDRVATFDPADAAEHGFEYHPLFAVPRFFEVDRTLPKDFDIYFVGTVVTLHRFDALAALERFCTAHDLRLKMHLRCSPPIRLKLLLRGKTLPGLSLRSIAIDDIIDMIERSHAVYDFANHAQSGYTMRFIENMCAGIKIITENGRVLEEDFYQPDRFLVHTPDDLSEVPDFLDRPIESAFKGEQFSIDNWARRLLRD